MAREGKPEYKRSHTHTYSVYDAEFKAIIRIKDRLNVHTPADVFRFAIAKADHPAINREKHVFQQPRPAVVRDESRPKRAKKAAAA